MLAQKFLANKITSVDFLLPFTAFNHASFMFCRSVIGCSRLLARFNRFNLPVQKKFKKGFAILFNTAITYARVSKQIL